MGQEELEAFEFRFTVMRRSILFWSYFSWSKRFIRHHTVYTRDKDYYRDRHDGPTKAFNPFDFTNTIVLLPKGSSPRL